MKVFRSKMQSLCIFMAVLMLIVSIPRESVFAALIDTEKVMNSVRGQEARDQVKQFLAREDIQATLIANGIDPTEAKKRIGALSDDEAIRISDQIDQLPAGGNVAVFFFVVLIVFVLTLIVLDLSGVTDFFTFTDSEEKK